RCGHAADDIERRKTDVPEQTLEVVTEDKQKEHVTEDVGKISVHEHRTQKVEIDRQSSGIVLYLAGVAHRIADHLNTRKVNAARDLLRDQRVGIGERLVPAHALQQHKDENVDPDENVIHIGRYRNVRIVITDRKHIFPPVRKMYRMLTHRRPFANIVLNYELRSLGLLTREVHMVAVKTDGLLRDQPRSL